MRAPGTVVAVRLAGSSGPGLSAPCSLPLLLLLLLLLLPLLLLPLSRSACCRRGGSFVLPRAWRQLQRV